MAVVRGSGALLRAEPGGESLQPLATGTALTLLARTGDGRWLFATTAAGAQGWVERDQVVAFNVESLPVLEQPPRGQAASAGGEAGGGTAMVPLPTPTPTLLASPTPLQPVRPTPQAGPGDIVATVVLTDARLNIRSGPGTNYAIVGKALPGEQFIALGRNATGTWVQIAVPDLPGGFGWVSAPFISLSGSVLDLPISTQTGNVAQGATAPSPTTARAEPALSGRLVFQDRGGGTIYVYELATGSLRPLTTGIDPDISPDGRTVAFVREGGESGLYLIDIDGRNERRIYNGRAGMRGPSWSPDGQYIVFSYAIDSYECRDVGFGICLPDNPFLSGFPLIRKPQTMLARVDFNGQNYRDLPSLNTAQAPDWNEGGIVYSAATSLEITQDTPDGETRAVISAPYYQDPAWQPGAGRIVFQSREGNHWEIFAVNPDGSDLTALTRPVTTLVDQLPHNVAPAWSPDGRHIAYLSSRDANNSHGPWRIWVMNADGSGQRPLEIPVEIEYNFALEQMLSWGPSS
uniref:SH3 domain-containing protein n=1 Tax=Litorilinea aerophila TaxID=1204385 RepID=A0A540VGI9_9CHLR